MADQFVLSGTYTAQPLDGIPSFGPIISTPIDESVVLDHKTVDEIDLNTDSPVTVNFGGVTNANVVILRALNGKVKARITSADGSQQIVPFDYLILESMDVPITAIDLTRVPAVQNTVRVFLGEEAP